METDAALPISLEEQHAQMLKEAEEQALHQLREVKSYDQLLTEELIRQEYDARMTLTAGSQLLLMTRSGAVLVPFMISDDRKGTYNWRGMKKTIAILHQPLVFYYDHREYWTSGFFGHIKKWMAMRVLNMLKMSHLGLYKANLYGALMDGEYTIDLSQDLTPVQLQRKLEGFLVTSKALTEAQVAQNMLEDMRDQDPWWKILLPVIGVLLTVAFFLFYLSNYQLIPK